MNGSSSTTASKWLAAASATLEQADIPTARLDALVLLADEIGQDKSWILAHPEYTLQIEEFKKLSTKITQRVTHTPLAYIRGHAEFYGRDFIVNEHVLVPRPESESMIDLLKSFVAGSESTSIFDIGTGSGCLAITTKLELPVMDVYGSDVSAGTLDVAKKNAKKLDADIHFLHGNLLEPIQHMHGQKRAIILANLPYVPVGYPVNEAARHEPDLALFGGEDGLDCYRLLFNQLSILPFMPVAIITEALLEQHQPLMRLAKHAGYTIQDRNDLAQLFVKR